MITKNKNRSLLSSGMIAVLVAQFFSALADNAVLIIAIALIRSQGLGLQETLLQAAFVVPFILLAPFAGPVADGLPKGRVMLVANLLKLTGALLMAAGFSPLFAYCLVGVGATLYSPAKYGILTQLVDPDRLVRANSMLEGSTIVAILFGVLLGGWLTDHSLVLAFAGVMLAYLFAAIVNLFIPQLEPERPIITFRPGRIFVEFYGSIKTLISDRDARFSLMGTSIFWGSGVTLRLLLFAWVPAALALNDNQTPAALMGIVSIGIVLGAAVAGVWISLKTTDRALLGGLLLGPVIFGLAAVSDIRLAAILMALVGFCGGLFVVPLNALLQETGHLSVGAGKALAIQNLGENLAMLCFLGGYSLSLSSGVPVIHSVRHFGLVILLAILGVALLRKGGSAIRFFRFLFASIPEED